jgi:hypothetical protein
MLIELNGRKIMFRLLTSSRATGCDKVAVIEGNFFAMKDGPKWPTVYVEDYAKMKRASRYGDHLRTVGTNCVRALGSFGLVDVKAVEAARAKEKWQKDFDYKFEELERAAKSLGLKCGPGTLLRATINAKAKSWADKDGWNGQRKARAKRAARRAQKL